MLLDVLRDDLGLTGTKEGCREGDCGTCVILLGTPGSDGIRYVVVNSCLLPVGDVVGRHVVTIEGLNQPDFTPVQQALLDEGAIQCGFCTPGLVIALTGFLLGGAPINEAEGIAALGGNICRCTGHVAIRRAIARLCAQFKNPEPAEGQPSAARIAALVARGVLPHYFLDTPERFKSLAAAGAVRNGEARSPIVIAGGTDLFVTQADKLRDAELEFLSRRQDLQGIHLEGGVCRIGSATPLTAIEASPIIRQMLPDLARSFGRIASVPIRNRATLAGNIVNASPAADMSIILLALNATLVLSRKDRQRTVLLRDFFRGYKVMDLAEGEMIAEIRFATPEAGTLFHFEKVARREHMDIASVNSAIQMRFAGDRIIEAHASAGGVAPIPLYLRETASFLRGRTISAATAREAAAVARGEIAPISDVRGSAEYKRALLPRLILAHFLSLFPDLIREKDVA